jgi:hypothetical protein
MSVVKGVKTQFRRSNAESRGLRVDPALTLLIEPIGAEMPWDQGSKEIAAPIAAMVAQHPPEVQEETWAAIAEAARGRAASDGNLRLKNLALLAAGRA